MFHIPSGIEQTDQAKKLFILRVLTTLDSAALASAVVLSSEEIFFFLRLMSNVVIHRGSCADSLMMLMISFLSAAVDLGQTSPVSGAPAVPPPPPSPSPQCPYPAKQ